MEVLHCEKCGTRLYDGYTDDFGNLYCCENCLPAYMNEAYGKKCGDLQSIPELTEDFSNFSMKLPWNGMTPVFITPRFNREEKK